MPALIDLTGRVFGRYTVVCRSQKRSRVDTYWQCRCMCGTTKDVGGKALKSGAAKSCGCAQIGRLAYNRTHGMSGTREFRVWVQMMRRCYDAKEPNYPGYGGRGIEVCQRWHDPRNFLSDMWPKPEWAHSIDRLDNNGPYSPENCRWATRIQQTRNRRVTLRVEGVPVAELCERFGVPYQSVRYAVSCGKISTIDAIRALGRQHD